VRTGLRGGCDVIEAIHDRIRETIVAQMPEATLRTYHGRLAQSLEGTDGADAEAVALHWLGAGDFDRAARLAEGAAEQAATKLAFDQAARLFRLALEHAPPSSPAPGRLRVRLAEVLRLCGRFEESARAFLDAAEDAPVDQKVEFRRAAAEQLLNGGRIDEGKEILHQVLAAVGMSAPRSPLAAVFWLLVYRVWLAWMGLRVKHRAPGEVSRAARLRIEALSTVSLGFAIVDVILGACMQARHLIEALRAGDRYQVARATSIEAAHLAAAGGPESRRELALVEIASKLAESEGSDNARLYFAGARGIGLFNRGHWRQASEHLEVAIRVVRLGQSGLTNSHLFAVYSMVFMGQLREAKARMERLMAQAEDNGDLYVPVNLKTSSWITLALADGQPERARAAVNEAVAKWSQSGFHVQHWQALLYGAEVDAYEGHGGRAYDRVVAAMPRLKKSFLLHAGFIRTMTCFVRGRLAIASIEERPELRVARVADARRMARKLRREHDPWAAVVAQLVLAAAENAVGDRGAALAALRAGLEKALATDCDLYALAIRYRLGQLLGGDEGRAMAKAAIDAAVAQGAGKPERWLGIYLPGTWSAGP
jgi:eukaryotic-like serine/threonine-protein kinase